MTNLKHWDLSSAREGLVSNTVGFVRAVLLRGAAATMHLKIVLEILILLHRSHAFLFWKVRIVENLLILDRHPLLIGLMLAIELFLLDSCDLEGFLEVAACWGLAC